MAGALREELNNILLSCLAEEAKRAHAAQEAIEVCRAAGAHFFPSDSVKSAGMVCLVVHEH